MSVYMCMYAYMLARREYARGGRCSPMHGVAAEGRGLLLDRQRQAEGEVLEPDDQGARREEDARAEAQLQSRGAGSASKLAHRPPPPPTQAFF